MSEQRMLIMPAELVKKIDDNRGDMSQVEFVKFLIDNQLKQVSKEERYVLKDVLRECEKGIKDLVRQISKEERYVTADALREFEQGIKQLMREFLDFVVSCGLELGRYPLSSDLKELMQESKGKSFHIPEKEKVLEAEQG
jgi:hypothetical protein